MNDKSEIEKLNIENVNFTLRTENILRRCGITHLEELTRLSSRTLLRWRGLGKKSFKEIIEKLSSHGLHLTDHISDPEIKKVILIDLPKALEHLKAQLDEMQHELRFFSYKIESIAEESLKTKKKLMERN